MLFFYKTEYLSSIVLWYIDTISSEKDCDIN